MGKNKKNQEEEIVILPYSIEVEVNRLWLDDNADVNGDDVTAADDNQPLGVQGLLDLLVAAHPEAPVPLKRQIRMAKNMIPYRYITSSNDSKADPQQQLAVLENDMDFHRFVQQAIEQRSNYKAVKQWEQVNEVTERLRAMGVELDDKYKTWKIVRVVTAKDQDVTTMLRAPETGGVTCQMCGRLFGSKNQIFRHLRDPTSSCGNAILGRGESLAEAPSAVKKQQAKQRQPAQTRTAMTPQTGATTRHDAPPEACIWIGDLPLEWTKPSTGQYKHLKALLFRYSPPNTLSPLIKTVIRKAYRQAQSKSGNGKGDSQSTQHDVHQQEQRDAYLGYAILVYRDAAEAKLVMEHMKDIHVRASMVYPMGEQKMNTQQQLADFVVKIRPAFNETNSRATNSIANVDAAAAPGLDPPIFLQLLPLPMEELKRRYVWLCIKAGGRCKNDQEENLVNEWNKAPSDRVRRDLVAQAYADHYQPRRIVSYQGKPIPLEMQTQLVAILQDLRWPAENHRAGLSAERYLVLTTSSQSTAFEVLKEACRRLMDWTDADYYYSGIAVTKNFVASPHIDDRDQTFQYAVSLGDFTEGGELCVEGTDGVDFVNVIETKNRIARADGRNVHWVRTWHGGDRYSLIFYDTSDRFPTPILPSGVDLTFIS